MHKDHSILQSAKTVLNRGIKWHLQLVLLLFLISGSLSAEIITSFPRQEGSSFGIVYGLSGDQNGNIYAATDGGARRIAADGTLTDLGIAGTHGVAVSPAGEVYFSSNTSHKIFKLLANGSFVVVAGTGVAGYNGDGIPASQAQLNFPLALAFDSVGNLYVGDTSRIRKIDDSGVISTLMLSTPVTSIAFDSHDILYFSLTTLSEVRRRNANGSIQVIAQPGNSSYPIGDNGPAILGTVRTPIGLAFNNNDELLIADWEHNRIRKIDSNGIITTFVGNDAGNNSGDGGQAQNAGILAPRALFNRGENLYIAGDPVTTSTVSMRRIGPLYKPSAPKVVYSSSGNNAGVGFLRPGFDGGSQITGYTVSSYPAGGVDLSAGQLGWNTYVCPSTGCVLGYVHEVADLNPGQTYTFTVHAINAIGAGQESGVSSPIVATIPTLSIADASIVEGNSGTSNARFVVSMSKKSNLDVTFNVSAGYSDVTASYTAIPGSDFLPVNFTGRISAGQTSVVVDIPVFGDTTPEIDEYFNVVLSEPINAIIADGEATGIIVDDELIPLLSVSDFSSNEGDTGARLIPFFVSLSIPAKAGGVKFDIESSVISSTGNSAAAGSDFYPARLQQVFIPEGQTQTTFTVKVLGDTRVEPDEIYAVKVSNVTGAAVAKWAGVGVILNDDLSSVLSTQNGQPVNAISRTRAQCNTLSRKIVFVETRVASGLLRERQGIEMILNYESLKRRLACLEK